MPESELMKKITTSEGFQVGMKIGKAGASAGMNIIGGFTEGLTLVKDSSVKNTLNIVDRTYGEEAAKATQEGFSIAGNLFGVYQMTYSTGLIGISASEMMRIQEEEEYYNKMMDLLTNIAR